MKNRLPEMVNVERLHLPKCIVGALKERTRIQVVR